MRVARLLWLSYLRLSFNLSHLRQIPYPHNWFTNFLTVRLKHRAHLTGIILGFVLSLATPSYVVRKATSSAAILYSGALIHF